MPAPVISASSSILGYRRNESFAFQPAATNTPTSWAAVGLPSGLSINSSTGLISGSVATAGVYVVTVSATNADPATGTREFVIGISPESAPVTTAGDLSLEWDFDMVSRKLSSPDGGAAGNSTTENVLARWKKDDVFLLRLRCRKNGVVIDPSASSVKVILKELEPDPALVIGSTFVKTGTGESTYLDVLVDLSAAAVTAALSNYEADKGTTFQGLVEVQIETSLPFASVARTLRISSQTATVQIDRDLVD